MIFLERKDNMNRCDICLDEKCKGTNNEHKCNCKKCVHNKDCYKFLHPTIAPILQYKYSLKILPQKVLHQKLKLLQNYHLMEH